MDQALIGAGVGATIQVALQNIIQGPMEHIIQVCGVDDDMEDLKDSLLMMQDFVSDAEIKQQKSKAVRRWLEQLEDVAFEAEAVLDEFNYKIISQKFDNPNQAWNEVTTFFTSGLFRKEMADKIKSLNKRLDAINMRANSYGLQMSVMSTDHSSSSNVGSLTVLAQTDSFFLEPNVVGRETDELEIVDMLLSAPHETITVVPVVGMGGLGKTTLARKVFHHVTVGAHFQKRIWVCVSINFDATTIFKMILESLSHENVQLILTKEVVLEKIRKILETKRYFLVLDDVWNENSKEWDDFMSSLMGVSHVKGNAIVVTTRRKSVASIVGPRHMRQLGTLSEDDCWSIIKSKAFSRDVPLEFEEIGYRIAQACGGLPLVAKVVGGLLCGRSKNEWRSILTGQLLKFGLADIDNTVMNILKLSYDRLPSSPVKKCFAYCSIFPQDYEIKRQEVIELWMAEGFLQAGKGKDMEDVGDEIFNFLLQNSLFQNATEDSYGNITKCSMHDLVHNLAHSVLQSDVLHRARYLAIDSNREESFSMLREQAKCLRTIFFGENFVGMFLEFRQLHVLKIMDRSCKELHEGIGGLIHLRLLDISGTSISYLPDSIGKLYNLQTLLLPTDLIILPRTIVDLTSLRHLHSVVYTELPPWMGNLICLQTLPYFKVGHQHGCRIGELRNLNDLKGCLEIQNLEKVKDKEEAKSANLCGKANIFGLVMLWSESKDGEINDENVLDGLQPHPSLKSLKILGYKSRNFPPWTMKMAVHDGIEDRVEVLHNLMEINLEGCEECLEVPMFGHLPNLRFLELNGLSNVQSLGQSFYGFETADTSRLVGEAGVGEPMIAFPALEKLELCFMIKLSEWAEVNEAITVFPCLKELDIKNCPMLNSLPSRFPSLEHLRIARCARLNSVPSHLTCLKELALDEVGLINLPEELVKNKNLRKLKIVRCHKLKCLDQSSPGGGGFDESSLEVLEIEHCLELESVFSSIRGLTSLRELNISWCKKLRYLPLDLDTLESLKALNIHRCPELRLILYGGGGGDSQLQGLTSLELLSIRDSPAVNDLSIDLFQSCSSSLQRLTLYDTPKLMDFPSKEIHCLRNLNSLEIGGLSELITLDSLDEHLSHVVPNLCSLKYLTLYGTMKWKSLPHQIQHLPALERLWLFDFEIIEALPEWIGNLSSLEELWFRNCKWLTYLPSMEAMLKLTKLHTFRIDKCPFLNMRCRNPSSATTSTAAGASSEWPKISHIKHVFIDGWPQ